jgi:GntR family transcriptional regulator of arabinose operon
VLNRDNPVPLYYQVYEALKKQMESGHLKAGDKLPSESEMIETYGIGRLTIRSALSKLVHEGYLRKLRGKGTYCIFNGGAAKRLNIDVILDLGYAYFISYFLKSVSAVLKAHNCNIIISDSHDSSEQICDILEDILKRKSSGVIVQPSRKTGETPRRISEAFQGLKEAGIPYIMVDSFYEGVDASYTVLNEYKGGCMAARYFYNLGHRRLGMIHMDQYKDSLQRSRGFSETCGSLKLSPPLFIPYNQHCLKELAAAIKARKITALFCYNDELAVEVLKKLKERGFRIPADISILGFDDSVLATTAEPALTSIAHPKQLMGELAARTLLNIINKKCPWPFERFFAPKLVKRNSCSQFAG